MAASSYFAPMHQAHDRRAPEDEPTAVPTPRPLEPKRPDASQRPGPPQRPWIPQPPQDPAPQSQRGAAGGPRKRFGVQQASNPDFALVFRGYEREAVDRYVAQVIELITELEATQTREGTVQKALEEVGEQTSSILQQAHGTAEEIASSSRAQAEARLARAERESEQMVAEAEAEARRIRTDALDVWKQRSRLIEELRRLSEDVLTVADDALERLDPPQEPSAGDASERPASPSPASEDDPDAASGDGQPEAAAEDAPGGVSEPIASEPAVSETSPTPSLRDGDDPPRPKRRTVGPIGDPLDVPAPGDDPVTDEQPAVRRVGPERRQA